MSKILLIDWNSVVKSDKLIRFPVSIALTKELFGDHAGVWGSKEFQEKYEDKLNVIFENMRKSGIEFFSPGGSSLRRLISMLWWFYVKKNNPPECSTRYFVDAYKEYEDTYNLDPELFEYLYNEYYEYFQDNYAFEVFPEVQRLVDRKPDDWELGIFSTDLAEGELNIVLDKPKSVKNYGAAFKLRFGVNGIISAYAQDIAHPSEVVAKDVNKFKQNGSNIFLLYRSSVEKQYFDSDIGHILLGKEDLMDRFDFDNPGQTLVATNSGEVSVSTPSGVRIYQAEDEIKPYFAKDGKFLKSLGKSGEKTSANAENNPKKIAYPHDIVMGKFPSIQRVIDFYDNEGDLIGGVLMAYSLLVVLISTISEWLGLIDSYSDVIFYALGVPFLSWFAVMLSIIVFLLVTTVPVDTMNRYYKNKELGLGIWDATWKAIKPVIMWTTILILLGYIF